LKRVISARLLLSVPRLNHREGEGMSVDRTGVGRIGDWLWLGGRMRVLKAITTNGGKVFEAGEIIRLERLVPYGAENNLATSHWISESDPTKGLCMSGWLAEDDGHFELVIR